MPNVNALISDADGTLIDTVPLIRHGQYEAVITFLADWGIPEADLPTYEQYELLLNGLVGGSARQTLERTVKALYEDKTHHLEGMDYEELHKLLDPIQDKLAPEYVKPYPGLATTLIKIGEMKIKLAIFTSSTPYHIVRNFGIALKDQMPDYATLYQDKSLDNTSKLNKFVHGMQVVFDIPELTVITSDDVGERTKPAPLSAQLAMTRLNVTPEKALILGDHSYDLRSGADAGINKLVGITHGFEDRSILEAAGATKIINSLSELPLLLTK